jgi:mitochondrial FAD-linked sulfhydryl oxidase
MPKYKMNHTFNMNNRYSESFQENLFDKQTWGPKLWEVMHTFSFAYPISPSNTQKQSAINFFSSIGHLIPCSHCSQHCLDYTKQNPPQVQTKQSLVNWVYNFHNKVNQRLGKATYSKEKLNEKYEDVAFCQS